MNVLFVGTGSGGSWEIRGKQIGRALGARVSSKPNANDWEWADVVVLVKHASEQYGAEAKASGARLIWDVLDWWKQPEENQTPILDIIRKVQQQQEQLPDVTLIAATKDMADELGGVCIPHHSRPGLKPASVPKWARVVAYEGTKKYLGSWGKALATECHALGLEFVINPPDLSVADIVVAFRGEQWDGPICRRWKSGVKIANAMAIGRPILTQPSAASIELSPIGTFMDDPMYLDGSLEFWLDYDNRVATAKQSIEPAKAYTLEAIARQYRHLFDQVMRQAA
jgi:hypothetical protein